MGFPFALKNPPDHDGPLPDAADVVVIGGGIMGVVSALYLRRRGLSVVVLEKGRVAAEQSGRNWGWIRTMGRDLAEVPWCLLARKLWWDLEHDCGGNGVLGLRTVGLTYLARTQQELDSYAAWLERARGFDGLDSRLVVRDGLAKVLAGAQGDWLGALHTPGDMVGEPWVAVPKIARLAVAEGVTIREGCAARCLDLAGGRVAGVVTERGTIRAGQVVLAGGAWSALFLRNHGVALPQLSVRATVMATAPMADGSAGGAVDDRIAWRRRDDGGYSLAPATSSTFWVGPDAFRSLRTYLPILRQGRFSVALRAGAPRGFPDAWTTPRRWRPDQQSPFEAMRILAPDPDARAARATVAGFTAAYPGLGPVTLTDTWAGMIDTMPDVVPVVDHVAPLPGLVLATGLSGHGFGIGPGFAQAVADLITGQTPAHDLHRFRWSRFSDGSPIDPGPGP